MFKKKKKKKNMDHIKKINLIYVIFSTIKESCQMNSIRTYNAKLTQKKKKSKSYFFFFITPFSTKNFRILSVSNKSH